MAKRHLTTLAPAKKKEPKEEQIFDKPNGRRLDPRMLRVGQEVYRLASGMKRGFEKGDPEGLIFKHSVIRGVDPLDIVNIDTTTLLPFKEYEKILVSFSGGKDSLACVLHLLERGVPKEQIELWHQSVDGDPDAPVPLFDWPVTTSYCKAVAAHLGLPLRFQWRKGGFQGQLLKMDAPASPMEFDTPRGRVTTGGVSKKLGTRLKFPQKAATLTTRWCTQALKIDPCKSAIAKVFPSGNVLVVTGERWEESTNRSYYSELERYAGTTQKRRVDQWRAVLKWNEKHVWEIIRRHGIRPHPAYEAGFSRCSCMPCIFSNASQWATIRQIAPDTFLEIASYETSFKTTITQGITVGEMADKGTSYLEGDKTGTIEAAALVALEDVYSLPVYVGAKHWTMPPGAFKHSGGPSLGLATRDQRSRAGLAEATGAR